ncbi:MAG: arylesterase [Comamonas sp.]|nr:arylesterase [Comamonas sp.]
MQNAQKHFNRRHFIASATALVGLPSAWASTTTHILVLGDSLSAEYGLAKGTGWVALLEQRLAAQKKLVKVTNASVSGDTTSGGRARLPRLLAQHQPSIVIIELGGNDALRGLPLQGTQDNLRFMTQAAQKAGAKVLLLGMQIPPNYGKKYAKDFESVFAVVANEDKGMLLPFFLKGIADSPNASEFFQSDQIHPNAKAQPIMLDNMWPLLAPLL